MDKIEELQKLIDKSNKIVFFGGAGVSTESGIPDFRSKDGLYNMKYDYPPEYMLSSGCLHNMPDEFFKFYKDKLNTLDKEPNICHKYLKKLEDKKKLSMIVTQNIDGLHEKAGSKNIALLHGTIYKNHCMDCGKEYDEHYIFDSKGIPKCTCGGIVRPNVVLYQEQLPEDEITKATIALHNADLLIVAGTSLTVYPAAGFIHYYGGKNLVIINKDETSYDSLATLVIHEKLGDVFSKLK